VLARPWTGGTDGAQDGDPEAFVPFFSESRPEAPLAVWQEVEG
jgi:hypothetical protein